MSSEGVAEGLSTNIVLWWRQSLEATEMQLECHLLRPFIAEGVKMFRKSIGEHSSKGLAENVLESVHGPHHHQINHFKPVDNSQSSRRPNDLQALSKVRRGFSKDFSD